MVVGVTRGEGFGVARPGGDVEGLVVDSDLVLRTSRIQMRCFDLTGGSSQSNSRLGRYSRREATTWGVCSANRVDPEANASSCRWGTTHFKLYSVYSRPPLEKVQQGFAV